MLELYINSLTEGEVKDDNVSSLILKVVSIKEKRALEFLVSNYGNYDINLALVICQLNNFKVKFNLIRSRINSFLVRIRIDEFLFM